MSRNTDHQFVDTDTQTIIDEMVSEYESITGKTVKPASPEKLIIEWAANIIIQERVYNNYTGNQNLPSRASGSNLDALGELFFGLTRSQAKPSSCTVRFSISAAQASSVLIPQGTRVTDRDTTLMWATQEDAYIPIGSTYIDLTVECTESGEQGNGYTVGQICNIVDLYSYYSSVSNTTESDGGSDAATDDEFYETMRLSMDSHSTAGARGTYEYYAKAVSTEISDVVAISPSAGAVRIYVLMDDGTIATTEMKNLVLAACNADDVRPLTDNVSMGDATYSAYNIDFTYYVPSDTLKSQTEMTADVVAAVNKYVAWQNAKFGRDINPDKLREFLFETGVKRVTITSPTFTVLSKGSGSTPPQIAQLGTTNIVNGGYEDE